MPSARTDHSTADEAARPWRVLPIAALALAVAVPLGWFLMYQFGLPPFNHPSPTEEDVRLGLKADLRGDRRTLGPPATFDLQPVSEEEAERRIADYYLRAKQVDVVEVLEGVPDDNGRQKPLKGMYTLVTRGLVTTPLQVIRTKEGRVEPPARGNLVNPDVIVQYRDGKVIPLRTELPMR